MEARKVSAVEKAGSRICKPQALGENVRVIKPKDKPYNFSIGCLLFSVTELSILYLFYSIGFVSHCCDERPEEEEEGFDLTQDCADPLCWERWQLELGNEAV